MASFEGVKVGDKVVIDPPHFNRPRYVAKVERVTQTQFIASGYRFNKNSGRQVSSDPWNYANAYHPTLGLLAAVSAENRYAMARRKLANLRNQLETVTREIDHTHDKHQLAETMEAAAADVTAAVAKLREAMP